MPSEPKVPCPGILWLALRTKRPAYGDGVQLLREAILGLFPDAMDVDGAVILDRRDGKSETAFFAHMDTMHREEGTQSICWDPATYICEVSGGGILGADDGAGCAILAELAQAGVPGLYVWTPDEERGASWAREHSRDPLDPVFEGLARIISFDRRGTYDLIRWQTYGEMASKEFCQDLGSRLGYHEAHGLYTDGAEWVGLVDNIVNLSVGYEDEHSADETLDCVHLAELSKKCIALDWESLSTVPAPLDPWDPGPANPGPANPGPVDSDPIALDLAYSLGIDSGTWEYSLIEDAVFSARKEGEKCWA